MIDRDAPPAVHAQGVLDAIGADPEAFDMGFWLWGTEHLAADAEPSCGTTLCVAGWAAHNAGYDLSRRRDVQVGGIAISPQEPIAVASPQEAGYISEIARRLLGLDDESADILFAECGADDAMEILRRIAAGEDPDEAVLDHVNS